MKQIIFSLSQTNGNRVTFEMSSKNGQPVIPANMMQDQFSGSYLFPAMLRLVKGASKLFDRNLPVFLSFAATFEDGNSTSKTLANIRLKSSSVHAVRKAVLVFNEAIAGMVTVPGTSIYSIADMKGGKGAEYRNYAQALLRPSVSLTKALASTN